MPRSVTLALGALVFIGVLTFSVGARPARADHYLGATVKWARDSKFQDDTRQQINVTLTSSSRWSWTNFVPANPPAGTQMIQSFYPNIEVLDKNGARLEFFNATWVVDSVNSAEDWATLTASFQFDGTELSVSAHSSY